MTKMMNRQARLGTAGEWYSFGPVSHCDAAKKMAIKAHADDGRKFAFYTIHTRCVDAPGTIQKHVVQHREEFVVMPQRGGE